MDQVLGSTPMETDLSNKIGRWTPEEHELFVKYLLQEGKDWKRISERIKTRTAVQVRTHAQKYFLKLINANTRPNKTMTEIETKILHKYAKSNEEEDTLDKKQKRKPIYHDENSERHNKCLKKEKIQSFENDLVSYNRNGGFGLYVPFDGAIYKNSQKLNLPLKPEKKQKLGPIDYTRDFWGEHMMIPTNIGDDMMKYSEKDSTMDTYDVFQLEPLLDDAALDLLCAM